MAYPCLTAVAITGSVPRQRDNRPLPVTVAEQVERAHAAHEAGASLFYLHARNGAETPSSDPARVAALQEGIRRHCPGIVVPFSTGGHGRAPEERGAMLAPRPDLASLATGSVNVPTIVHESPPGFLRSLAATMLMVGLPAMRHPVADATGSSAA